MIKIRRIHVIESFALTKLSINNDFPQKAPHLCQYSTKDSSSNFPSQIFPAGLASRHPFIYTDVMTAALLQTNRQFCSPVAVVQNNSQRIQKQLWGHINEAPLDLYLMLLSFLLSVKAGIFMDGTVSVY